MSGEAAVDNRTVQATATLCDQLQNEIVMSGVRCAMHGTHIGMGRFGFSKVNIVKRDIICFIPHIVDDDPLGQLKSFIVSSINFKLVKKYKEHIFHLSFI